MELWIRSQDRETLIKTENISIDNENYIIGNLISDDNKSICDYWRLGHYETKERALQILDEMQNILQPQILIRRNDNNNKVLLGALQKGVTQKIDMDIKELSTYVYEMPEE